MILALEALLDAARGIDHISDMFKCYAELMDLYVQGKMKAGLRCWWRLLGGAGGCAGDWLGELCEDGEHALQRHEPGPLGGVESGTVVEASS